MAWTDWSNTIPVDHSKLNTGPSAIRAVRSAISERLDDILYGFTAGEAEGNQGIKNLPFVVQGSDPGATADKIKLYAKDVSSKAALFIEDEDANVWQFSQRANDLLSTFSTVVPAGYTDITATYNDKFMRYSTGAVETTGGADTHTHGAGSYAGPSHTHTFTTGGVSFGGGGSLTAGALDTAHTHSGTTDAGGTGAITGTSASGSNVPAYFTARLLKRS